MKKVTPSRFNYRIWIFVIALIISLIFSIPTFTQGSKGPKISFGLDLQGGLSLVLGINAQDAIKGYLSSISSNIRYFTNEEDILIDGLHVKNDGIDFELLDPDALSKLTTELKKIDGLSVEQNKLNFHITLTQAQQKSVLNKALGQAVNIIRNRLDQFGLSEPSVTKQGNDGILVELPGIKTTQEASRVKALIAKAAHLQFMAVDESRMDRAYTLTNQQASSYGDVILSDAQDSTKKFVLKSIPILDGSMLSDATVGYDRNGDSLINFTLNSQGADVFGKYTSENIGNRLAIVLDNKVYSDPVIRDRIGGGRGQISGAFTPQEATDIAIALRSGSLLAPVKLLEERTIGPSLGSDSVKASSIALVSGFLLVAFFMLFYYRRAGIIANIALVVNLLIIVSVMAILGATLTLPGIAGIILTVGMAVDSNVIINERIRESLRKNINIVTSIETGYKNAMSAILDSNITTLITTFILYVYGTGPIKGFAITMGIGILASMLTAILGTHGIYEYLFPKIKDTKDIKKWFGVSNKYIMPRR